MLIVVKKALGATYMQKNITVKNIHFTVADVLSPLFQISLHISAVLFQFHCHGFSKAHLYINEKTKPDPGEGNGMYDFTHPMCVGGIGC